MIASSTTRHPAVDRMVIMLDNDPSLSGKQLSEMLGLSVSRLARLFKRELGISIVGYRNELRFQRFHALLTTKGERPPTLGRAARLAGFGSYAHFHRLCRARWHTAPRDGLRKGLFALTAASVPSGTQIRAVVVSEEP